MEYRALMPALVASMVGDQVTRFLGVVHPPYPQPAPLATTFAVLLKWIVFGLAVAACAILFVELTHRMKALFEKILPRLPLRMMLGGIGIVLLWKWVGTSRYLGLGLPTLLASFSDPNLPTFAFAWKILFTALTLSVGFLGGEVTPLFFVGATMGAVLAPSLGLPQGLGAAVGLAAVFGAAANTPLALSIMAVELLGAGVLPHVAVVMGVAYLASGHRGIYPAQRVARSKFGGAPFVKPVRLHEVSAARRSRSDRTD